MTAASASLAAPPTGNLAEPPPDLPPQLAVIVDTEEEFDWGRPLARGNTRVASIAAQHRAQEIFAKYDLVPNPPLQSQRGG